MLNKKHLCLEKVVAVAKDRDYLPVLVGAYFMYFEIRPAAALLGLILCPAILLRN